MRIELVISMGGFKGAKWAMAPSKTPKVAICHVHYSVTAASDALSIQY